MVYPHHSGRMPPRLRCLAVCGQVKREPGQGSTKISECLGCPRNGKQARTYQENFPRFPNATVNSPVHGKAIRQILQARIPASDAYGYIAWGDILIDISFARSSRNISCFLVLPLGMLSPGKYHEFVSQARLATVLYFCSFMGACCI